jgi:hypothetical protein
MNLSCFGLLFMVCSTAGTPPSSQVTIAVCPVTAPWSRDYQRRVAAELKALPSGSAIDGAVAEALSLRDQARACRARK